MSTDPKTLQQLEEPKGGASPLEWSTISNVHGKALEGQDLVKQLQTLSAPEGVTPLEWSTISNIHAKA